MKTLSRTAVLLMSIVILGGCATSRSVVNVAPVATAAPAASNGKTVFINSTKDRRMFAVNPPSPSTPSLDPSEAQNDHIRSRAIGRKRNSYGKALGDILLKEGETVESITSSSLRQAFAEKGYRVLESPEQVNNDTYIVDADIDKFWSWMNPGFWAITLNTEISTGLTVKTPTGVEKHMVSTTASDGFQIAVENNWMEVMNQALKAYVDGVKAKLK